MLPGTYGRALALTADGAAHMVDIKSVGENAATDSLDAVARATIKLFSWK